MALTAGHLAAGSLDRVVGCQAGAITSPLPEVQLWERLPADGEPVATHNISRPLSPGASGARDTTDSSR